MKKSKIRKKNEELSKLIKLQENDERYYESLKEIYYDDEKQIEHIEKQKQKNKKEWMDKINSYNSEILS